eukprot:CAMPEP_0184296470 /NCGR_PEP_ID=MMETSP1049-20130417/7442_1 /TAXON_ID=77928 /ORGANISM="Proteomonas sulcata, Strain CCMP704" /LENGTH=116 /DNA_ID=CAMNT_0026605725 /DNA_START=36 /DNA_END=386 /DNA_ORIENTATION=+
MFHDIVHFTQLTGYSSWPAADVINVDAAADGLPGLPTDHITDAHWNYGADFGGGSYVTQHDGGVGAYGSEYIADPNYSFAYGGAAEFNGSGPMVKMCTDMGCSYNHNDYSNLGIQD